MAQGTWAGAVVAAAVAAAPVQAAEYQVDAAHTNVGFRVRHVFTKLPGQFREFSGSFTFDPKTPGASRGTFTARTASISTNEEKRDAHLRSEDFFWAEKYPELTLEIRGLKAGGGEGRYRADALLTIRGVAKPVSLDVEYLGAGKTPWGSSVASFEARARINRKEFGLTWNKALETGGVLVGEEVELLLDVEGVERTAKP